MSGGRGLEVCCDFGWNFRCMVADKKVADIELDMVAVMELDMVADMEVYKVVDMVALI